MHIVYQANLADAPANTACVFYPMITCFLVHGNSIAINVYSEHDIFVDALSCVSCFLLHTLLRPATCARPCLHSITKPFDDGPARPGVLAWPWLSMDLHALACAQSRPDHRQ